MKMTLARRHTPGGRPRVYSLTRQEFSAVMETAAPTRPATTARLYEKIRADFIARGRRGHSERGS